ncbi:MULTISPECIES: DUF4232 domain-containing protein [Rhodococcus]|uniref:DUF4232 domain-containing protein n=1 Tax=Rhodococcus globerulus TaxID=33008 RepID=A0ABU4BWW8_RHOGO|nr:MULTISPECIES: DUF4232 domain-containing protein [Rhodococcus]MDV6268723.1 DUF4232 domain-containing protein [Rhodococcus globerulus]NRI69254.1 DUF4232 domain-containing protein [Rhodococcus sp. MS16]
MNPTVIRRIVLLAASLTAIALVSGCGSDSSDTATSTTVPTTTSALPTSAAPGPAPATTTHATHSAASSTQVSPENCTVAELSVTLGQASGAAGSTELPVVFTNTSTRTCTLDGFPGVSYVTGADGSEVGAAATRTGSGSAVSLAPGSTGTALVRATNVENYPADQCGVTDVAGLRVYPPNSYDAVFLPYPTEGCSMTGANINQLSVAPVTG